MSPSAAAGGVAIAAGASAGDAASAGTAPARNQASSEHFSDGPNEPICNMHSSISIPLSVLCVSTPAPAAGAGAWPGAAAGAAAAVGVLPGGAAPLRRGSPDAMASAVASLQR